MAEAYKSAGSLAQTQSVVTQSSVESVCTYLIRIRRAPTGVAHVSAYLIIIEGLDLWTEELSNMVGVQLLSSSFWHSVRDTPMPRHYRSGQAIMCMTRLKAEVYPLFVC